MCPFILNIPGEHGKVIMYADDVQLIDSEEPCNVELLQTRIESTLAIALAWFTQNSLKINPTKTEFLILKTRGRKIHPIRQSHFSSRS